MVRTSKVGDSLTEELAVRHLYGAVPLLTAAAGTGRKGTLLLPIYSLINMMPSLGS